MSNIETLKAPESLKKFATRIRISAALLISVMCVFSATIMWNSFSQARNSVSQHLQTSTSYNEHNLTRTIEAIDSELERVRSAMGTIHETEALNRVMAEVLQFSPHLRQILVVDNTGLVLADTARNFYSSQTPSRIDLRALGITEKNMRSLGSRMRIGEAMAGRFIGPASHGGAPSSSWFLPIALLSGGGDANQLNVLAAIHPIALSPNLHMAVYKEGGEALVTHLDGRVIYSSAELKSGLSPATQQTISQETSGRFLARDADLFRGAMPRGQDTGVVSYQLSKIYPLAVVIAAAENDILQGWLTDNVALVSISISIPFLTALIVTIFGIQAIQKLQLYEDVRILSQAVEQSPASIIITDKNGTIQYINSAFTKLFGYSSEDVAGQTPRLLKSGHISKEKYQLIWQTITSGQVWRGEMINKTKDGQLKWINAIIFGLATNEKEPEYYVGIETDITLQKEYETQLVQEKMRAETANIAKTQFLASMSHELRTPLNAILGFGQLLTMDAKDPLSVKQQEYTKIIVKSGMHLLELIEQVLDLAQIETGKLKLSMESVALFDLCKICQLSVTPQANNRNIQMNIDVPPETVVWADAMRLKEILLNLLSNAIKYNRDGGSIWITATALDNAKVRISVTDTGDGITPELHNKLFEPFNRLGKEGSVVPGTGIGLNITKDLTEAMGGEIGFASESGKGSTFWVDLPIANPQLMS
jgi:PAS domain S-box-containing protein